MSISIAAERPDTADAIALIEELEGTLASLYSAEDRYGYSVEKLIKQGVLFYVTRYDDQPAGCGGVQFFGKEYAEVKRMYVRPEFRGRGLAKKMLDHLAAQARENGIHILRLETGIFQEAAIGLYERYGFMRVSAFGDYIEGSNNIFYEMSLL